MIRFAKQIAYPQRNTDVNDDDEQRYERDKYNFYGKS